MARNPLSQLASLGEEVLGKASQSPTAARVLQSVMQMKDRVDDLTKRVRGLEQMEKRLSQLEKRLAKLEGGAARKTTSAPPARSGAARKTASKKTAAKKPGASGSPPSS
jgi:TolA-binding protein